MGREGSYFLLLYESLLDMLPLFRFLSFLLPWWWLCFYYFSHHEISKIKSQNFELYIIEYIHPFSCRKKVWKNACRSTHMCLMWNTSNMCLSACVCNILTLESWKQSLLHSMGMHSEKGMYSFPICLLQLLEELDSNVVSKILRFCSWNYIYR